MVLYWLLNSEQIYRNMLPFSDFKIRQFEPESHEDQTSKNYLLLIKISYVIVFYVSVFNLKLELTCR